MLLVSLFTCTGLIIWLVQGVKSVLSASLTSIQWSKHCPSGLDHRDGHQRVFALVVEERVVRLAGERSGVAQRTEVTGGN